jgi:hypothetical protein
MLITGFSQFYSQSLTYSERTFWYGINHKQWLFCPQIFNGSKTIGASLSISDYKEDYYEDATVNWKFEYYNDGYCYISNENSKLYLQPEKAAPIADSKIIQAAATKTDLQKWFLVQANDEGGYYIVPKTNEKLAITYAGGSILLKEFQKENQIFYFDFYNECFAGNTLILDENNNEIQIKDIIPGMKIQSYNSTTQTMQVEEVKKLLVHSTKPYSLTKIVFTKSNLVYANNSKELLHLFEIEGTQNHPILTTKGIKKIHDISNSDKLLIINSTTNQLEECEILSIVKDNRIVNDVYNIKLNSGNYYLVNGIPASSKCPFVSVIIDEDFQLVDEVLKNQVSQKLDKFDSIEIPKDGIHNNQIELKIEELKDEISFIDQVYLKINDKIIFPDKCRDLEKINKEDSNYLQLSKGNSIILTFDVPLKKEELQQIHFYAKGYYELLPESK